MINHVRTLGAKFEFRTRCACNFDHISVLVTNMPATDAELRGKIKRHIASVAESADAQLAGLDKNLGDLSATTASNRTGHSAQPLN